jgi:rubrerythrin
MCSELFAAYFFLRISRRTNEPVLRALLGYMARDEFRHSASAGDVLKKRIDRDPDVAKQVLAAAEHFRHYGSDVVDVPVAEENDFEAIMAVNRKIRLLCGLAPTEHLKESITGGD